ncbi:chemotaxis protein [Flagellatimonas centrodinii]|uniref:chemotaxis protein n=1 Tax=Flagellatimonas centrodinii TaxID=2806210 RepID=UPI001FEE85EC|nr:chemotaxis protein [Flagellatimonas centrodinii]ULQ45690.1 chemotaxis protein [Flagellatimonas centrodinii]
MSTLLDRIDEQTRLAGHNRLALLTFSLGDAQHYAVNVFKVLEVTTAVPMTPVSGLHPQVQGLAELRGQLMPVIALPTAFGLALPAQPLWVVTEFNRRQQAFVVSGVERIVHVDVAHLQPPDATERARITALVETPRGWLHILDFEQVLADIVGEAHELPSQWHGKLSGERPEVLVVDDSAVARAQLQRTLTALGAEPILLSDGAQALAWLQQAADSGRLARLRLVISDLEMPQLDGYALTARIKEDPRLKHLRVLLHSSLSGRFNAQLVARVGADRFVPKFSAEELAAAVLEDLALPAAA